MAQIQCEQVTLGYDGHAIVSDLTFAVHAGDYLCVIGENGAGKSTLIKTLLGLQPPLQGTLTFGDGLRANAIGYLPQQTPVQRDFPASVREVVLSGCLSRCGMRPFYSKADKARALASMERLGIASLQKRCYRELSGGQQQRVLLARALCATSRLLVLDEPVAGLDPRATGAMYAQIAQLNREDGITVVMVSHDLPSALQYATHMLHIARKPLFFGTRDAYAQSKVGRRYIAYAGGEGHA